MAGFDNEEYIDPMAPVDVEQDLAGRPVLEEGTYLYSEFEVELTRLLNRHSKENDSGTPDYILADYLQGCLDLWNKTVSRRADWRGEHTELPALQRLREGKRTVPMTTYSGKLKMRNDIGEAEIKITPGEQVGPIGRITHVVAVFEEEPSAFLNEIKGDGGPDRDGLPLGDGR